MKRWFLLRGVVCMAALVCFHSTASPALEEEGWFSFEPAPDRFAPDCPIDLRFLNEAFAGEHGFIAVKDGQFVRSNDGAMVRFWGVNGPPQDLTGAALNHTARLLSKYGINLVRVHSGYFDQNGKVDLSKVSHTLEIVGAMKAEGIYTHLSIYFPLWLTPPSGSTWLKGYDGKQHPFAALFFNPDFQAKYRQWWTALLTTPNPKTGKALIDEPALASVELQNEDSFFFWTFAENNIPDAEWRLLETQFGQWLRNKYGSLESALAQWHGLKVARDQPAEGRIGFRSLWQMAAEKTPRDQDTIQFLFEVQSRFYSETHAFLRQLGFKGAITASNWSTASPEIFGPIEKMSYTTCDFIDRHGYFSCNHKGGSAEWSIREGQTYSDRSALRFDAEEPGKSKQFVHPAMDPHYDRLPSMISETTWTRPNRYRSEAPIYLAAYGALQHSDAIVHFALDGAQWSVKPGFWMQPWTLLSPAMIGQFPAAALIYRQGLIRESPTLVQVRLSRAELLHLKGTPLPQDGALDELRLKEVPPGPERKPGQRLDPLLHYVGRTDVIFTHGPSGVSEVQSSQDIDHTHRTVQSSTGELFLDYGKGWLKLDAPKAQGVSGALLAAGSVETKDLIIRSDLEIGHIVVVSLDGEPVAISGRLLLQVMSEEKASGFETAPISPTTKRIISLGHDPWMVKKFRGEVAFKRADAKSLRVTRLDLNGNAVGPDGTAERIQLDAKTLYYLLTR
jgi:hypothetical protein